MLVLRLFKGLEEIGNYSGYSKVLRNQVQSSIEIIRSHVISNRTRLIDIKNKLEEEYLLL